MQHLPSKIMRDRCGRKTPVLLLFSAGHLSADERVSREDHGRLGLQVQGCVTLPHQELMLSEA